MSDFDFSTAGHMGGTYRTVLDRSRTTINDTLGKMPYRDTVGDARVAWDDVQDQLDQIPNLLAALQQNIVTVTGNIDYTPEALNRIAAENTNRIRGQVGDIVSSVNRQLDMMMTRVEKAALPPRPTGPDAEARIAAAKTDAKMVLDAVGDKDSYGPLADRIGELLTRAIGDGDDAMTWVLGASRWPADYTSTLTNGLARPDAALEIVQGHIDQALNTASVGGSADYLAVRKVYRALAGRYGVNGVKVALNQLNLMIDDVRSIATQQGQQAATAARQARAARRAW